MEPGNQTRISEFILLGLSEEVLLQPLLFWLFQFMYLVTFIGNLLIILAIITDALLHIPGTSFSSTYLFQTSVSPLPPSQRCCGTSRLRVKLSPMKAASYRCIFFMLFGILDNILLTVMAYDRFAAICHPLQYMIIMNPKFCDLLLLTSWLVSVLDSLLHALMILRLSFCTKLEIHHFFCELYEVVQLACSDTFLNDLMIYFASGVLVIVPLTGILFSYSKIVSSILKISSTRGKYKAFSTCVSHLSTVSLFYGTSLGVYLSSASTQNSRATSIASVMYTVVTPMLNPFIYSLKNKDIKQALKTLFSRETFLV